MSKDRKERKHRRTARHPECVAVMAGADFDAVPPLSVAMGLEADVNQTESRPSIIRAKVKGVGDWLYVSATGALVRERDRAERLTNNEAGRRMLQYLNDYPGWTFEEVRSGDKT
jgi:hypothetical protein